MAMIKVESEIIFVSISSGSLLINYRVRSHTYDELTQPTTEIENVAAMTLAMLNILVLSNPGFENLTRLELNFPKISKISE